MSGPRPGCRAREGPGARRPREVARGRGPDTSSRRHPDRLHGPVRPQRCSPEVRSVLRTRVTLAVAALLILGASAAIIFLWMRTQKGTPEKSIAVLPFENRSDDKANAYFADGIQDEILTRLSKIAD